MQQRLRRKPCGCEIIAEHPFATLKYRIFVIRDFCGGGEGPDGNQPGSHGLQLKRMVNVVGAVCSHTARGR